MGIASTGVILEASKYTPPELEPPFVLWLMLWLEVSNCEAVEKRGVLRWMTNYWESSQEIEKMPWLGDFLQA